MNAKLMCLWVALLTLPTFFCLCGQSPNRPQYEDIGSVLRQTRTAISDLRHQMNNHEVEIRMFEERLKTQENMFDHVRQELFDNLQTQKDFSRATSINLEGKIDSLDNTVKSLVGDLKQMRSQSNDSVNVLAQYKQKLVEFEKIIEVQNQHMKNLEVALGSIMEVLQAKEAAERASVALANKGVDSAKAYKVQSGDSLEKIARYHKVSVQALRDMNNLVNDRIIVGQTLKIPGN